MRLLLITLVCCCTAIAGGVLGNSSTLQLLQDNLNHLGKTMLETSRNLQSTYGTAMERLNERLVQTLMRAYQELDKIHRNTGEFIEGYNMTDKYCMEIVGYLYWAHAQEAVTGMQECAMQVVNLVDEAGREGVPLMLEQARLQASEVTLVVVRELTKSIDSKQVEKNASEQLEEQQFQWLKTVEKLKKAVDAFVNSRKVINDRTELCTKDVIDQYNIHMGYIQYYLNKNKNCQR